VAAGALVPAALCLAHFTWVAPVAGPLQVGKQATIGVFHGHHFPEGEEKIDATFATANAIPPSGRVVSLSLVPGDKAVTAVYTPRQAGLHRIVCSQDRGVVSRTPQGVKPGGRDRNPDAAQSYKVYRSSIAYLWAGQPGTLSANPTGLEFEMTAARQQGEWVLTVYSSGKPAAGVEVGVFHAGAKDEIAAGKTDSQGVLRYKSPGGIAGAVLFSADWKAKPPAGAAYDSVTYSTSLYVQN
jgi:hypothetical protein